MKKGKHRIPSSGGDEYDAFSKWGRRLLCVFNNHTHIVKQAQRKYWKRERRIAKEELSESFRVDAQGNLIVLDLPDPDPEITMLDFYRWLQETWPDDGYQYDGQTAEKIRNGAVEE